MPEGALSLILLSLLNQWYRFTSNRLASSAINSAFFRGFAVPDLMINPINLLAASFDDFGIFLDLGAVFVMNWHNSFLYAVNAAPGGPFNL
jgi:hypothetical protein